jgi:hypothetical protein
MLFACAYVTVCVENPHKPSAGIAGAIRYIVNQYPHTENIFLKTVAILLFLFNINAETINFTKEKRFFYGS